MGNNVNSVGASDSHKDNRQNGGNNGKFYVKQRHCPYRPYYRNNYGDKRQYNRSKRAERDKQYQKYDKNYNGNKQF